MATIIRRVIWLCRKRRRFYLKKTFGRGFSWITQIRNIVLFLIRVYPRESAADSLLPTAYCLLPSVLLREAVAVFGRYDESLHHLRLFKVAIELVQLVEPELKTGCVSIAPQIAEVFHHDKRVVELQCFEPRIFGDLPQHLRARCRVIHQAAYQCIPFTTGKRNARMADQRINVSVIR